MRINSELVQKRFSKQASDYQKLNTVQDMVAKELISFVTHKPKRILDLGAGTGAVFDAISWELDEFMAVDFASNMCALHPVSSVVKTLQLDFNISEDLSALQKYAPFDLISSSSALQWSLDLEKTLQQIAVLGQKVAFALFTSGTFGELRSFTSQKPTLISLDDAREIIARYFEVEFFVRNYELEFDSARELFDYIRKTGVGGGAQSLSFKETRQLISSYPSCKLEFETLFAVSK